MMVFKPKNKILAILHHAAELCLMVQDRLFFLLHRSSAPQQQAKILIIRLDAIGDFITWLASAKEIRALYAGYHVTLLGNDLWTDLAKELAWFDDVWPLNRKRFFMNPRYRWMMLKMIHRGGFRIVLHPVLTRDFLVGDVSVRASGAPVRIGFTGNYDNISPWHKKIGDTWYSRLIDTHRKHQLEWDADFAHALGAEYKINLPVLPRRPLPNDFPLQDYYIIVPGAGHEMRQWPLENFTEIMRRIYRETGLTAVLCGGKREYNLGRSVQTGAGAPVVNLIGRTSLLDLVSIIAHARFLIGNDTGAIHIAIATSTPSVCILGGAHPGRHFPYPKGCNAKVETLLHDMRCFNCDWQCIYNPPGVVPCISSISVDEAWDVIRNKFIA